MTQWIGRLYFLAVLVAFSVILLGAYTRLVDAGLGCPDWPTCYGQLSAPSTATEITQANSAYPSMPVNVSKARTEMAHRYFAEGLGALIVLLAGLAYWKRRVLPLPQWLPLLLVVLVVGQGLLGMLTVTLRLLPLTVLSHLAGGFSTLVLLWLAYLYFRKPLPLMQASPNLKVLSGLMLVVVICQILLGAWTSANYAALACPDFPTCRGQWWPHLQFSFPFHDITTIHMMHRVGALITLLLGLSLAYSLRQCGLRVFMRWWVFVLLLQLSLGIANVVLHLPLATAVAHNGVAALLLLSIVTLNFRLHQGNQHGLV